VLATWDIRSEKSRTGKQAERRCLLFVRERKIRQGRQKRATPLKVAYLFLRVEKKEEKRQKKGAEALKMVE
jgi:hypothetical protein